MIFKKKYFLNNNKKIVFLLVGWQSQIWKYYFVVLILLFYGFDVVAYEYDFDVLSPNVGKTIDSFNKVIDDLVINAEKYKKQGYSNIHFFGTSLGSTFSLIAANKTNSVDKVILNLTGADLAEVVWSWDKINPDFKEKLNSSEYSLNKLQEKWKKISPITHVDNLSKKKLLVYLAKKDEVIPYQQGMKLIKEFNKRQVHYKLIINEYGNHIMAGFINLLKFVDYINFLRN